MHLLSFFLRYWQPIFLFTFVSGGLVAKQQIIIAHRGASGYLPEHTLPAKAMAYAMHADYLEQDLVMTKDNELVVLHDHFLDRISNVATIFPGRARADGRFYAIDFTLAELRRLQLTEGFQENNAAVFPKRFPLWKSNFTIHTFAEEIEFIQGLNHSTGRQVGLYPEIKSPWFHHKAGKDISLAVLETLKQYGYTQKNSLVYLQCFDANELQRIRKTLFPALNMEIKLIQLIAETNWQETFYQAPDQSWQPYDYDWMKQKAGLEKIATYAHGIGPWMHMIVSTQSSKTQLKITDLVKNAHAAGLLVHPYTLRKDELPKYVEDFTQLLELFLFKIGVDGIFTDFPDLAVTTRNAKRHHY